MGDLRVIYVEVCVAEAGEAVRASQCQASLSFILVVFKCWPQSSASKQNFTENNTNPKPEFPVMEEEALHPVTGGFESPEWSLWWLAEGKPSAGHSCGQVSECVRVGMGHWGWSPDRDSTGSFSCLPLSRWEAPVAGTEGQMKSSTGLREREGGRWGRDICAC